MSGIEKSIIHIEIKGSELRMESTATPNEMLNAISTLLRAVINSVKPKADTNNICKMVQNVCTVMFFNNQRLMKNLGINEDFLMLEQSDRPSFEDPRIVLTCGTCDGKGRIPVDLPDRKLDVCPECKGSPVKIYDGRLWTVRETTKANLFNE